MTRQDAISQILAIVDGAQAPAAPVASSPAPSDAEAPKKKPKASHSGLSRTNADDDEALDSKLAFYPLTDLGNAERFRDRNRGRFLYTDALGWFCWDTKRWAREGVASKLMIAEHEVVRSIQREARAIKGTTKDKRVGTERNGDPIMLSGKLKKWGRASEGKNKLRISTDARGYLAIEATKFNADPYLINVENGTLVARKTADGSDFITLKDHDPDDLITKLAPVEYRPGTECPLYDKFLARVQPELAMRAFLHRWMGYSLTGDAGEQKFAVFWGKGRNGKGVFVETCCAVAGDYAEYVPIETFLTQGRSRAGGQATPDLMLLFGARMVRSAEPEKGARFDEALIKQITGGDPVQARDLNHPYIRFRPIMKLTIAGNHQPRIAGADEGIWSRVQMVPWLAFIPEAERDLTLGIKLLDERCGILNRLLDGLRDYLEHGLAPPQTVKDATEEYRRNSDQFGRFLEACTERVESVPPAKIQSSALLDLHNAWARANAGAEYKGPGLAKAMEDRGFKKEKSSVFYWLGLRATKSINDFVDHEGKPLRQTETSPSAPVPDDDDKIGF